MSGKHYALGYARFKDGIYGGTGVVRDGGIVTPGTCPSRARLTGRADGTAELTQKLIEAVVR